jgi:putative Mn2+ efflux pump MntP
MSDDKPKVRHESGSLIGGIILIGLGLLFLAIQMDWFYWLDWGSGWPLIIIIVGVALLVNTLFKNWTKPRAPQE